MGGRYGVQLRGQRAQDVRQPWRQGRRPNCPMLWESRDWRVENDEIESSLSVVRGSVGEAASSVGRSGWAGDCPIRCPSLGRCNNGHQDGHIALSTCLPTTCVPGRDPPTPVVQLPLSVEYSYGEPNAGRCNSSPDDLNTSKPVPFLSSSR
jgi:hypothetical protein